MRCKSCEERRRKMREAAEKLAARFKRNPGAAGIKANPATTAQEKQDG